MKIGKKSKQKKIIDPFIVSDDNGNDMVFHVKPMRVSLRAKVEAYFSDLRAEMFTIQEITHFAKTHVEGWENVFDEDGKELEFTQENSVLAISDIDNEDLAVGLYMHSYNLATGLVDAVKEDTEQAKKS